MFHQGIREDSKLIEGCADGADRIACHYHPELEKFHHHFKVVWENCLPDCPSDPKHRKKRANGDEYCPRVGPARNQRMLDEGKPQVVFAFTDDLKNSKGTKDMVTRAKRAGVPTYIISRYT